MPSYRLLIFRASRLERWEEFEADSDRAAVEKAAGSPNDVLAELWSADGKIAIFRPSPSSSIYASRRPGKGNRRKAPSH